MNTVWNDYDLLCHKMKNIRRNQQYLISLIILNISMW